MSHLRAHATPTHDTNDATTFRILYNIEAYSSTRWSGTPLGGSQVRQDEKRQLQITTTITPTITRGPVQTAIPTNTVPQRPGTSQSPAAASEDDSSLFPANLSWWQVLGIAVAGIAVVGIVVFMFISRGKKKKAAALKAKELEEELGKKRKEADDLPRGLGLGMGMGGMGMGMGMGGMGMGMGGMPMMYGQGGQKQGKSGKGRGRRRHSDDGYDWSSSGTESYDDFSDGGTIRRGKRRKPRRRKERHKGRRRKDDEYSDDSVSSASDSTYYARPKKDRGRKEPSKQDRRQPQRTAPPTASSRRKQDDMPLGLGPPTTGLRTGSSGTPLSRKRSKTEKFRDSVFSTLESMRDKAIRLKQVEQSLKLKDDLIREEEAEAERQRQRQLTVKEANERLRREQAEEERARQNMIPLYATPQPQQTPRDLHAPTPLIPPVPRSQSRDARPPSRERQPSRQRGKNQLLGERLAPASAYNSALPQNQAPKYLRPDMKRSPSDLPYAYDGVASIASSRPPLPAPSSQDSMGSRSDFRSKSSRKTKPPLHRQDSDLPLKSAMRTSGDRKPRRKATITEKPPTTRMITDDAAYRPDSNAQSDWLPKPPKFRPPPSRKSSAYSDTGSVSLVVPHPKDRPIIKPGGLAPAPLPKAKVRARALAEELARDPVRSDSDKGAESEAKPGWGQWLGWKGSGGMGTVEVSIPPVPIRQSPVLASPESIYAPPAPLPAVVRQATPPMPMPIAEAHQPGKRWANRLRERR